MKAISLLLALVCAGCASRTWVETTDQWRAVGESSERIEEQGIGDLWLEVTGPAENDGFQVRESLLTTEGGEATFSLLPAALQALGYNRDVELTVSRTDTGETIHTTTLERSGARDVVIQWHAQVRLGAEAKLRQAELDLLKRILTQSGDAEVVEALKGIRPAVTIRQKWE